MLAFVCGGRWREPLHGSDGAALCFAYGTGGPADAGAGGRLCGYHRLQCDGVGGSEVSGH